MFYLFYVKVALSYVYNHGTNHFTIAVQFLKEVVSAQCKQATEQKPLLSFIKLFKTYE